MRLHAPLVVLTLTALGCDYGLDVKEPPGGDDALAPVEELAITDPRDGTLLLTWAAPDDVTVRVLRTVDVPATSEADPAAVVVYEGGDNDFVDADPALAVDVHYFYAAYAIHGPGQVAAPDLDDEVLSVFLPPAEVAATALPTGAISVTLRWPNPIGDVVAARISRDGVALGGDLLVDGAETATVLDEPTVRGIASTYSVVTVDGEGVTSTPVAASVYIPAATTRAVDVFTAGDTFLNAAAGDGDAFFVGGAIMFNDGTPRAFGDVTLPTTAESQDEGVLARVSDAGAVVWARRIVGTVQQNSSSADITDVAVAPDGDLLVVGTYGHHGVFDDGLGGTLQVDAVCDAPCTASGAGYTDAFVARYSSDGVLRWVSTAGAPTESVQERVDAVHALPDGGGVIAGSAIFVNDGSFLFAGESMTVNDDDAWVVRFDANGGFVWGRNFPGSLFGAGVVSVGSDIVVTSCDFEICSARLLSGTGGATLWTVDVEASNELHAEVIDGLVLVGAALDHGARVTDASGAATVVEGGDANPESFDRDFAIIVLDASGALLDAERVVRGVNEDPADLLNGDVDVAFLRRAPDGSLLLGGTFYGHAELGEGDRALRLESGALEDGSSSGIFLARYDADLRLSAAYSLVDNKQVFLDDAAFAGQQIVVLGGMREDFSLATVDGPVVQTVPEDPTFPDGFVCILEEVLP